MLKEHKSCDCKDSLCPACALFGTLGKSFQVASRLRFSDAYLTGDSLEKYNDDPASLYENVVTLSPLSSPKLNNMEFYLKKPDDAWFWTYDYYIDSKGEVHVAQGELNGRKFYWHNMNPKLDDQEVNALNTTVRPVSTGVQFRGRLFFDSVCFCKNLFNTFNISKSRNLKCLACNVCTVYTEYID